MQAYSACTSPDSCILGIQPFAASRPIDRLPLVLPTEGAGSKGLSWRGSGSCDRLFTGNRVDRSEYGECEVEQRLLLQRAPMERFSGQIRREDISIVPHNADVPVGIGNPTLRLHLTLEPFAHILCAYPGKYLECQGINRIGVCHSKGSFQKRAEDDPQPMERRGKENSVCRLCLLVFWVVIALGPGASSSGQIQQGNGARVRSNGHLIDAMLCDVFCIAGIA